jgi:hypothetical protein
MLFIRFVGICMLVASMSTQIFATTADELAKATDKGKTVFLLVFEPNAQGIEPARGIVKAASEQVKKSTVVQLDRSDATNSELVAKYRLAGVPLPLIMMLCGNGAIAGGIPAANTTAEKLIKMVPTAKKAEVLKAVQDGQSVLITAASKKMPKETSVSSACAAACGQMQGKCTSIKINLDDDDELPFLNELKISPQSKEPVTVVINAQGQVTGSFAGGVEVGNLVQAATKKAGGCCPSGGASSSSCGPTKK